MALYVVTIPDPKVILPEPHVVKFRADRLGFYDNERIAQWTLTAGSDGHMVMQFSTDKARGNIGYLYSSVTRSSLSEHLSKIVTPVDKTHAGDACQTLYYPQSESLEAAIMQHLRFWFSAGSDEAPPIELSLEAMANDVLERITL